MDTRNIIKNPIPSECKRAQADNAFNAVKKELEVASLNPIDEAMPFAVECDASEYTIFATLNQAGRPVAFMSRTLHGSKLHRSSERGYR